MHNSVQRKAFVQIIICKRSAVSTKHPQKRINS